MELGKQIAYYRKQKGMTQDALAKQLNISNQAVSKWEANQSYPDITLIIQLADIFEVSLDQLFGREWKSPALPCVVNDLPWEADEELRAVVYVGKQLVEYEQLSENQKNVCSKVKFTYEGAALNVSSVFGVNCGDVAGNVDAAGGVKCGHVGGNVTAGDGVNCGNVGCNVTAGDGVICGNIGGDVHAGDGVVSGSIEGNVDAGDGVQCGDVGGNVTAGDSVECKTVNGNVMAETVIYK